MLRRILPLLALVVSLPLAGATRWVTERAGGPVQWLEWSPAAIARAQKANRPIFLSIGSAASWDCHRMAAGAFADASNAKILNAEFVPLLLDPIEHPEVAEAYELALTAMHVPPGCPRNLVLAPSLEPFAAGAWMSAGELKHLLVESANRWAGDRAAAVAVGRANLDKARALAEPRTPSDVDLETIESVVDGIAKRYEQTQTLDPMAAAFLLRYAARTKHEPIRTLAFDTLKARAASPLRDQLGGGFHRCDGCFEKVLPDQAIAAMVYTEAWRLTNDPDFRHVARTTVDYVLRDLRAPKDAAFQASQDAHSLVPNDGRPMFVDGAFYVWTKEEIERLVGRDDAAKVSAVYSIGDAGTHLPVAEVRFLGETYDELAPALQKLLDVRQKRPAPFREPVVVAGWNGLTISALARAATAFDEPHYVHAAALAANALLAKVWNAKTATLARTDTRAEALAEDYAFVVQGLLDLHESAQDVKWLELAIALQRRQDALFWDASAGRYATGRTLPEALRGLLVERDEDVPNANAVAAVNLMRLAALTNDAAWSERPSMIFQSFGGRLRAAGVQLTQLAAAYELARIRPRVVVVTGNVQKEETRAVLRTYAQRAEPMRALVLLPHKGTARERVVKLLPYTSALLPDEELPAAYECVKGTCRKL